VAYPVHFDVGYQERYSRLSTFFRLILIIPHAIWLGLWGIVVFFTTIVAWFAVVFTGRYPRGLFRFTQAYLSYYVRVNCYAYLLTDKFPPFGGGSSGDGYPVQLSVDVPERLSRLTTFFRIIMAIPALLVLRILQLLAQLLAFFGWFVIVIMGRLPKGLFEVMELPQRYQARVTGYLLLLVDAYPWFQEETLPEPEPWAGPPEVRI
jgi:Domain of unknown function (DUF4389)